MKQLLLFITVFATCLLNAQSALNFGGTNAYVTFGNNATLRQAQFTIECWFMRTGSGLTTTTGTGGITSVIPLVTKGRGEADGSNVDMNWFLGIRSTDTILCADFEEITPGPSPGLNHPVYGVTQLARNVWYHAAATYDGTTWRLYLNGGLEATLVVNRTPQNGSIQHAAIGSALTSTGAAQGFFKGVIDEVRVWSYARTQTQIQTSINQQISSPVAGLVARWGLNEGVGTSVGDNSGNFITGTITGTNWNWVAGAPFNINIPPSSPVTSPANNQNCVSNTAHLTATSTDPSGGTITVNFYGRPINTAPDFTIIPIPDTQYYTGQVNGGTSAHIKAQTNWIVANRLSLNIAYCAELGDCVENGDNGGNNIEWKRADTAFKIIENPATTNLPEGIPYGVAVGNHDQSPNGDPNGTTTFYNQFFGASRFAGRSYWGGDYGSVNSDNNFQLFSASGMDFISIALEYDPAANVSVLNWADSLLAAYPNRRGIVYSHWLINADGSWGAQGLATYNALKDQPNLFLMLCGHIANGEAVRTDTYNGHTVYTVLSDYQSRSNGGDGWMRIMTFSPSQSTISVKTYSPTLNQYETDANSQFTLSYDMGLPWQLIGTMVINSGDTAYVNWSGLSNSTTYQWYSTVNDGTTTVTGTTQTFTTGTGNTVSLGNDISSCVSATLAPQVPCGACTYSWNTGATTPGISVNATGNYFINEIDNLGCVARDTIHVTINPLPAVTFSPAVTSFCADGAAVVLNGQSPVGGTFSGNGVSAGQFSPGVAGPGTHNVLYSYTDGNGCSNSSTVTLTVNPANAVNLGSDVSQCTGNVTLNPSSPCPACTYAWSTGATTPSISTGASGIYHIIETDANGCTARDTVNVTIFGLPLVSFTPSVSSVCPEVAPFVLTGGSPAGGSFSGPGVNAGMFSAQSAGAGTHSVLYSYTDGNGCSSSSSGSITVNPANGVSLGSDVSQCSGSVALNPASPCPACTYVWSTGATSASISASSTGTYHVTETDANGCVAHDTVNVTIFGLPMVSFTPPVNSVCPEINTVVLSGGSPAGGTYSGTAVSGGVFDVVTAGSGTHSIMYSYTDANGCTNSSTAPITVNPANTVVLGSDVAQCTGSVMLNPSSPCPTCTYAWSTGATTSSISAASTGNYSVTETDLNGCIAHDTVAITIYGLPIVTFSSPVTSACADAPSITLSGGSPVGGMYSGTAVSSGQFDPVQAGAGSYTLLYSYTDINGCSNSVQSLFTVHGSNTIALGNNVTQCGGSTTVSPTPSCSGCTYLWSTGSTASTISVSTSGSYFVTETDANGCNARDTVQVTINTVPTVTYTPVVASVCEDGGMLTLSGGSPAGGTYSGFAVSGGQFDPALAGAGTYSVVYAYTDANNCGGSDVAFITVDPLPVVNLVSAMDTLCINSAPVNLFTSPTGGNLNGPGVSGSQFDPASAGSGSSSIMYSYTDGNGCSSSDSIQIYVDVCLGYSSATTQELEIYPNPASSELHIVPLYATDNLFVKMYDATGKLVLMKESTGTTVINISDLASGIYQLSVITGNYLMTERIIIAR